MKLDSQTIFNRATYHMVARGGAPEEAFSAFDRTHMAKKDRNMLLDLDAWHRNAHPDQYPVGFSQTAKHYGLTYAQPET